MKKTCLLLKPCFLFLVPWTLCLAPCVYSQNVGIGTVDPNASSLLDITSTTKGVLIPRMATSLITSIASPAKGLMIYDSTNNQLMVNMGNSTVPNWQTIVFNSGWSLSGNSGLNMATHFIGTTDAKPLLFRVNNIRAGILGDANNNV